MIRFFVREVLCYLYLFRLNCYRYPRLKMNKRTTTSVSFFVNILRLDLYTQRKVGELSRTVQAYSCRNTIKWRKSFWWRKKEHFKAKPDCIINMQNFSGYYQNSLIQHPSSLHKTYLQLLLLWKVMWLKMQVQASSGQNLLFEPKIGILEQ